MSTKKSPKPEWVTDKLKNWVTVLILLIGTGLTYADRDVHPLWKTKVKKDGQAPSSTQAVTPLPGYTVPSSTAFIAPHDGQKAIIDGELHGALKGVKSPPIDISMGKRVNISPFDGNFTFEMQDSGFNIRTFRKENGVYFETPKGRPKQRLPDGIQVSGNLWGDAIYVWITPEEANVSFKLVAGP